MIAIRADADALVLNRLPWPVERTVREENRLRVRIRLRIAPVAVVLVRGGKLLVLRGHMHEQPTGREVRLRGVSIYDIIRGLIQRETIYIDNATLLVELGGLP